jgi:hypothetical protein
MIVTNAAKTGATERTPNVKKLYLENELLKSRVFQSRLHILHSLGATNEDLAPLINRLIHDPLDALGVAQDRKLISSAELIQTPTDEKT